MKLKILPLDERIKSESITYQNKLSFQTDCQEVIDFVDNLSWFKENPNQDPHCEVSTFIWNRFEISIDSVSLEDAIENLLGPIHRRFSIWWEMEITGDASEPVFRFTKANHWSSWISISIKEGSFKQCKIVEELDFIEDGKGPTPHFKLKMVCE